MLWCGPCVCRTLQCRRYASENCGCWEGTTEDVTNYILNWFQGTSVFNDLTPEEKQQALADAQTILEWAWDGIIPFYNAVRQWRTFANYVERMWLDVDESGPCDSSLYEDEEAFIIYISTAGAIHCKYLALVARRGRSATKELINKDAISDYLDWVTTEEVTYQFKDWDDEILSFWSVKKWETPVAPEDPSRTGYTFTGWNPEVDAISKDTTFVAQYEKDEPIPVQSVSNFPSEKIIIWEWQTTTFTFNYLPANANDFSNLEFYFDKASYDSPLATAEVTSFENGTATVTMTWLHHTESCWYEAKYILNGWTPVLYTHYEVWCATWVDIEWEWTVSPSTFYVPFGWLFRIHDSDEYSNPCTADIVVDDVTVDNITFTATAWEWYQFSRFVSNSWTGWYYPNEHQNALKCTFAQDNR